MFGDYKGTKLNALQKWLIEDQDFDEETVKENTGYNEEEDTYFFEVTGKQYLIADDEEIFIDCYDNVLDNADTFSTQFILDHTENWNPGLRDDLDYLLSFSYSGNINSVILALIGNYSKEHDFDKFVSDAISEYGAEMFLSGDYTFISDEDCYTTYNIFEDLNLSNQ